MKITEQAASELRKALENFGQEGAGIRVFSAQGCCGPSIQMEIATQLGINQTVLSIDGIDFYIDNDLIDTLATVTLEFGSNGFRLNGLPRMGGGCCG